MSNQQPQYVSTAEDQVNEFLNGRPFIVMCGVVMVISAFIAAAMGVVGLPTSGHGIYFDFDGSPVSQPMLSMLINVACVIAIGLLLLLLNKRYNFVRSYTFLFAASFFLLQMASPVLTATLSTGTAMCLLLVCATFALMRNYQKKRAQRTIFLLTTVATTCTMFQYAFAVLLIAFIGGFFYMRAMNFRSLLAILIGIFTPFWIVLGLGIVPLDGYRPFELDAVWRSVSPTQLHITMVVAAATVTATIAVTGGNLVKIFNYRLQTRVYNAFFVLVGVLAVIALCIDYRNVAIYLPLLNVVLSVQIAHAFTLSTHPKRYIGIIALVVLCLGSFAAHLVLATPVQ